MPSNKFCNEARSVSFDGSHPRASMTHSTPVTPASRRTRSRTSSSARSACRTREQNFVSRCGTAYGAPAPVRRRRRRSRRPSPCPSPGRRRVLRRCPRRRRDSPRRSASTARPGIARTAACRRPCSCRCARRARFCSSSGSERLSTWKLSSVSPKSGEHRPDLRPHRRRELVDVARHVEERRRRSARTRRTPCRRSCCGGAARARRREYVSCVAATF